ncbi:acyl-CoA dehydrogenase family protein [Cupriavidus basilensis]
MVVPDSARLGAPDEGWNAAIRVLSIERATNRMYRPWRFECELRQVVAACKSDAQLARLLDDGYTQRRIGDVACEIDALKGLVETTVSRMMAGESIGARGSLTKLYWSECHQAFAGLALSLLSHVTPRSSAQAQRARKAFSTAYLFSRAETLYAGTSEVQLDVIAQRILNLPGDLT